MAPLDLALKDGGSALRQHLVRGEQAGKERHLNFFIFMVIIPLVMTF